MILLASLIGCAPQIRSSGLEPLYLGQESPGKSAAVFAPGTIATDDGEVLFGYFKRKPIGFDGGWTTPRNPGQDVHMPGDDTRPYVTEDGKYLFFNSARSGSRDIYWVDARVIDNFNAGAAGAAGADDRESSSSDAITRTLEAKLAPIVEEYMLVYSTPGLAIGVVHEGRVVFTRGYGTRSLLTNEPITPRSVFHMASIAKPFVATAIVQLVERGEIELDASVAAYLPYFALDDPRAASVTIRQLLSHTSGMPDVEDYEWDEPQHEDDALEGYVRSLGTSELLFDPGESSRYSNIAFNVLGDVIAKVSGLTFEQYMRENIFTPLGMEDSTFFKEEVPASLAVTPHVDDQGTVVASEVYPYNRIHAPSSTLNSNVVDMCRWMLANLNRGQLGSRRILAEASYGPLWTRQTPEDSAMNVGLGWFLGRAEDAFMVAHSGSDLGFKTSLRLFPHLRSGVVVMANSSTAHPAVEAVSLTALGVLFRMEFAIEPAEAPWFGPASPGSGFSEEEGS